MLEIHLEHEDADIERILEYRENLNLLVLGDLFMTRHSKTLPDLFILRSKRFTSITYDNTSLKNSVH